MPTAVERAILDTNVILAATDESRPHHPRALAVINNWPAAGTALYVSGQILREYLVVATRPAGVNGLGLARDSALANVRELRTRLTLLDEDQKGCTRLLALLGAVECTGKQVHDANVVATMLVHGIGTIVTAKTQDFAPFDDQVDIIDLADVS